MEKIKESLVLKGTISFCAHMDDEDHNFVVDTKEDIGPSYEYLTRGDIKNGNYLYIFFPEDKRKIAWKGLVFFERKKMLSRATDDWIYLRVPQGITPNDWEMYVSGHYPAKLIKSK